VEFRDTKAEEIGADNAARPPGGAGAWFQSKTAKSPPETVGNEDPRIRMLDPTMTPKMRASTLLVLAPVSIRKLPLRPPSCM
jgi:hypothetical protein